MENSIVNPTEREIILITMVLVELGLKTPNLILPFLEKIIKNDNIHIKVNLASTLTIVGEKSPEIILPFLGKFIDCNNKNIIDIVLFALIQIALKINNVNKFAENAIPSAAKIEIVK